MNVHAQFLEDVHDPVPVDRRLQRDLRRRSNASGLLWGIMVPLQSMVQEVTYTDLNNSR